MAKIWEKDRGYSIFRPFVDFMVGNAFHSMKVEGKDNIPTDGAVILTPNHCNTLMDALVILRTRKEPTAFGARADIFRKPKVAKILRWLRIVPLARQRDGISQLKANLGVFDEAVESILNDVPFCMFVEGTHHPGYTVHPIKTGVFKIASSALMKNEMPVYIQPVGISYSDLFHFRGSVTVRFGKPIKAENILSKASTEQIETLTGAIQQLVIAPRKTEAKGVLRALEWLACLICVPVWACAAVASCLFWVPAELIIRGMKDKAWANTVRFGVIFALMPILTVIAAALLFCLIPWHWAVIGLFGLWLSPYIFYQLLYCIKKI